jgi:hypothetical protein
MDEAPEQPQRRSATERAERLVEQFGQRLGATREQLAARAASDSQAQRPATERAGELLDRAGEQVGRFAAVAGHEMRRFIARAREEAEDIWAEAQNKRQGGGPTPGA